MNIEKWTIQILWIMYGKMWLVDGNGDFVLIYRLVRQQSCGTFTTCRDSVPIFKIGASQSSRLHDKVGHLLFGCCLCCVATQVACAG